MNKKLQTVNCYYIPFPLLVFKCLISIKQQRGKNAIRKRNLKN